MRFSISTRSGGRSPATLAQGGERPRGQVLSLDLRADDFVELGADPTLTPSWCGQCRKRDQVGQRQRLEERAELVQAVVAARAQVEAEVELGGGVDLHRGGSRVRRCCAASPIARRNRRARAPRRARPPPGRVPPAPPGPATSEPGRTCSSERASDLRRWAKAARTSSRVAGSAPGPVRRRREDRRLDPGPRPEDGRVDRAQQLTSQASWASTLGEP